jgi:kynurenine formamidase
VGDIEPWCDAARVREIFESVKNWGRWGPDDEAGALNLITPVRRRAAVGEVRLGQPVSCARELPVEPSPENPRPALHLMTRAGDDCVIPGLGLETTGDFVGVAFHGMATSHVDALCHLLVDGRMYNGFPAEAVKSTGATRGAIPCARDGIVGRGVLLDIPRLRGVAFIEPNDAIGPEELSAAEAAQGVSVGAGDILLVATGRDVRRAAHGPWAPYADGLAGLHPECIPWLRERDIAVLGSDGVSDTLPGRPPEGWPMPVHQCVITAMGVHLLDNLRLDRLAATCAEHQQWTFLFTVAPLVVEGGTGSPANPIALL